LCQLIEEQSFNCFFFYIDDFIISLQIAKRKKIVVCLDVKEKDTLRLSKSRNKKRLKIIFSSEIWIDKGNLLIFWGVNHLNSLADLGLWVNFRRWVLYFLEISIKLDKTFGNGNFNESKQYLIILYKKWQIWRNSKTLLQKPS
jgi:hypothetical protein